MQQNTSTMWIIWLMDLQYFIKYYCVIKNYYFYFEQNDEEINKNSRMSARQCTGNCYIFDLLNWISGNIIEVCYVWQIIEFRFLTRRFYQYAVAAILETNTSSSLQFDKSK